MKRSVRNIFFTLLALVFLGSVGRVINQTIQYRQGDETYAQAEELAGLPDLSGLALPVLSSDSTSAPSPTAPDTESPAPIYVDPYADALRNMDFTALRDVNHDVLGWILIPGTKISYPLVQGTDNSYYLNHTWRKTKNSVGAIFLESTNQRDFSDFNTIIYGHRMNNHSMFGLLKNFESQDYWAQHPYIYLTDDTGSRKYEIFAAYEVSVDGDTYRLGLSSDSSKQNFLDYCVAQSVIDTQIVPTVIDHILTLSTCTGTSHTTRWVVQAVLKEEVPSDDSTQPAQEPSQAQPNASSSAPDTSNDPQSSNTDDSSLSPQPEDAINDSSLPQQADDTSEGDYIAAK